MYVGSGKQNRQTHNKGGEDKDLNTQSMVQDIKQDNGYQIKQETKRLRKNISTKLRELNNKKNKIKQKIHKP